MSVPSGTSVPVDTADTAIFFVVRQGMGGRRYSLEIGDHSPRYSKHESILYRTELPAGTKLTLSEAIEMYEKGVRAKPKP